MFHVIARERDLMHGRHGGPMYNWVRHSALLPAEPHNFRLLNGIPTLADTLVECRSLLSHRRSSQRTRYLTRRHGTLEDCE